MSLFLDYYNPHRRFEHTTHYDLDQRYGDEQQPAKITPLLQLAETMATPKEVRAQLNSQAKRLAFHCLSCVEPVSVASAAIAGRLNAYLDLHCFSGFQRKRSVDKAVKRAMKTYRKDLAAIEAILEREMKKHESCSYRSCTHGEYYYPSYVILDRAVALVLA